jgi:glucose-1-phosphate adenylyltransferase
MRDTLAFVMAGGRGARLMPLTADRSKPAVPFGGIYRLIDFTLSNCVNSQLYKIIVLPQYKSQSLTDHLEEGWNIFSRQIGHFLKIVPPQQRTGTDWYRGTADSIRQNLYLIERYSPELVLILSGDHIYKMDFHRFADYHRDNRADVTISLLEVGTELASQFGVAVADADFRIRGFQEKPKEAPETIPGDPRRILASMGIYLFRTEVLVHALRSWTEDDFGGDIIPRLLETHRVYAYPYRKNNRIEDFVHVTGEDGVRKLRLDSRTRDSAYWRDVGTLDAYWNANMDLTGVDPYFNLYGRRWPIHTNQVQAPPAKFVFATERAEGYRVGKALDSLVAPGAIVSGVVRNCVLGCNVVVRSWTELDESVIMDGVTVGRRSRIKKSIIDKGNDIPDGTEIGFNPREDRKRFTVTPRGITVVPKGYFS